MFYPKEFLDEYKKLPNFNADITFYTKDKKGLTSKQITKNEKGYFFNGQYVGQTNDKLNAAIQKFCTDNQYTKIELKQTLNLKDSQPSPTSAAGMAASRQHVEDSRKARAAKAAAAAKDDRTWIELEKLVENPETETDSEAVIQALPYSLHPALTDATNEGFPPLNPSAPPIVQTFKNLDDADSAYEGSPPNSPDGTKEKNSSRTTRLGVHSSDV